MAAAAAAAASSTSSAGRCPNSVLSPAQVTTTGQSYDETDIGYLTPGERGVMQRQAPAGTS
jgi:hypothetical protein